MIVPIFFWLVPVIFTTIVVSDPYLWSYESKSDNFLHVQSEHDDEQNSKIITQYDDDEKRY